MNSDFEAVIGLEVHTQLKTNTKIFCSCSTAFGQEPNSQVCPVCLGYPGVLPVMNEGAVKLALRVLAMIGCKTNHWNKFDRKNYFYPDLPKGYQISQFDQPIGVDGVVEIEIGDEKKRIGITRAHLEEDAGKLIHSGKKSLVDYNRTGVPLLEIVSEPDIRSSEEAAQYLKKLRQLLLYCEASDCNMEEGSFRCDANVSVRRKGEEKLGVKAEVKNLNSFKFVQKAIDFEIDRQINTILEGKAVIQETRLFNSDTGKTRSMRSKEEAHDYRYFPDPDLVPMDLDVQYVKDALKDLPLTPDQRKEHFIQDFGLPEYDAEVLTAEKEIADFFEEVVKGLKNKKLASNWIMSDMIREWNDRGCKVDESPVTPALLLELLKMIESNSISGKIGKEVFKEMWETQKSPGEIVQEKGLMLISDEGELKKIVDEVIQNNEKSVQDYRGGKKNALGFLVGQVMKATRGKADPKTVNELLRENLQ